jgi:hypothetical protein
MSIFEKIKGIFSRKKNVEVPPIEDLEKEPLTPYPSGPANEPFYGREPLPPRPVSPELMPRPRFEPEFASETKQAEMSNIRAKIDLLLTEMDSIKTQNQTINERLRSIEKTLAEMRGIRYY